MKQVCLDYRLRPSILRSKSVHHACVDLTSNCIEVLQLVPTCREGSRAGLFFPPRRGWGGGTLNAPCCSMVGAFLGGGCCCFLMVYVQLQPEADVASLRCRMKIKIFGKTKHFAGHLFFLWQTSYLKYSSRNLPRGITSVHVHPSFAV